MTVDFNLYFITDSLQAGHRNIIDVIKDALDGGLKAVSIREKTLTGKKLYKLAEEARKITLDYGARLFINDRVDIALATGADGVHLGENGFSPHDVRGIMGEKKLIGVSTHSIKGAVNAEKKGADFITLGPVYHTPSKASYGEPLGLAPLRRVKLLLSIPIFAIGGIKKENIKHVLGAGAFGVALISAIISAPCAAEAAKEILKELNKNPHPVLPRPTPLDVGSPGEGIRNWAIKGDVL